MTCIELVRASSLHEKLNSPNPGFPQLFLSIGNQTVIWVDDDTRYLLPPTYPSTMSPLRDVVVNDKSRGPFAVSHTSQNAVTS